VSDSSKGPQLAAGNWNWMWMWMWM